MVGQLEKEKNMAKAKRTAGRKTNHKNGIWANDVYWQVKHLADGILDTLKKADFLAQKEALVKKAKKSLEQLIEQVQESSILDRTKDLATTKTHELLSRFNIPTKNDVKSLNQRLSKLEKRLNQIAQH